MKTNKQCNAAPRVACFWSDYQIASFLKAKRESKKTTVGFYSQRSTSNTPL